MIVTRHFILDIFDAFSSIRRRPLRSLLSSLGIGIGVTALIAMLSISEGAKQKALAKITSLGTDTLRVEEATTVARSEKASIANLSAGLTMKDVDKVALWLGSKGSIGAYERRENRLVSTDIVSSNATVVGVSYQWFEAEKLNLDWGRMFDSRDERSAMNYCVVGSSIARDLHLVRGSILKVDGVALTVIGALKPRGSLLTEGTGLSALNFDLAVILPITALAETTSGYGGRTLDGMVVRLNSKLEQNILQAAEQLQNMLLSTHRGVQDFRLVVPLNLLSEARESQQMFSLVMGAIAGLSLLVGGIGVMNVMLANISEQTREIGLRMALGASRLRIIWLYLWNSMLLTLSGGVWGALGGIVLAYAIQLYAGWDIAFSLFAIVTAPLSALVTGLLFGLHPAIRAADLDPAVALRES